MKGTCKGLRFENGTIISGDGIINEQLKDDSHVYVILKGIFFAAFPQIIPASIF